MSVKTQQIADMLDMLPEQEQDFAFELIKKLVIAWDPDFTKLTPMELKRLEIGKNQIASGEVYSQVDIDWDNLDNMILD